jgi:hypothetical protein
MVSFEKESSDQSATLIVSESLSSMPKTLEFDFQATHVLDGLQSYIEEYEELVGEQFEAMDHIYDEPRLYSLLDSYNDP